MFAIFRFRKLKSMPAIYRQLAHAQRECDVPNALDNGHSDRNISILKTSKNELKHIYNNVKKQKNSVLAYDILLTASPEFFKQNLSKSDGEKWIQDNLDWVAENFGGRNNIVSAQVHLDESTPHIQLLVLPIVQTDKGPKLAARTFTDGKVKMQKLQDTYAQKMKPWRLQRGIRGSKQKHKNIKDYYKDPNNVLRRTNIELRKERTEIAEKLTLSEQKLNELRQKYEPQNLGNTVRQVPKPSPAYKPGDKPGL